MSNLELANYTRKIIKKHKTIRNIFYILLLIVFIGLGIFSYHNIKENKLIWLIFFISSISLAFLDLFLLFGNALICKAENVCVNDNYITVYRGVFTDIIYVNGIKKDRLLLIRFTNTIEILLSDGVRVTVTFGHSIFNFAYVSFSNGRPTIEL